MIINQLRQSEGSSSKFSAKGGGMVFVIFKRGRKTGRKSIKAQALKLFRVFSLDSNRCANRENHKMPLCIDCSENNFLPPFSSVFGTYKYTYTDARRERGFLYMAINL